MADISQELLKRVLTALRDLATKLHDPKNHTLDHEDLLLLMREVGVEIETLVDVIQSSLKKQKEVAGGRRKSRNQH